MITKYFFALLIFCFISAENFSQEYFQQNVQYTIHVKLDDVKHELTADETIIYTNNSPNDLAFLYFHLWPNAYTNNKTALGKQLLEEGNTKFYFAKEFERGYIDKIDFKVNEQAVKWEIDKDSIDICKIILNEPLKSGNSITITTPFHVKIPSGKFSRLGHIEQQYQITQWYPKPAVYDVNGWNQMPYLNQGEFYSEFGTYDVFITLPKNYVVGATGDYVDGEKEVEWLNEIAARTEKMGRDYPKSDLEFPSSDSILKTLHFHQEKVHDFAWFCDKRYYVLKGEVELPHSKRKVTTWSMFTGSERKIWKNSIKYINDAVYYYSLWNGDYPYNHATAIDGALSAGGGMEYPNITVIGKTGSNFLLDEVITHEVGHNWFYGILGSNERAHPWMDEGINSFYEMRYIQTKYPGNTLSSLLGERISGSTFGLDDYKHKSQYDLIYLFTAAKNLDQPSELHSANYSTINYGADVYSKTAIVFDYLRNYLGEETFDKAMQTYFDTWKFKHPQPNDLRKIMEDVSGKNLSWFFDDLIGSTKKLDYKIMSCRKSQCAESFTGSCQEITIKNNGEITSPVVVSAMKNGKVVSSQWVEGFTSEQKIKMNVTDFDKVRIDPLLYMPEINRNNNTLKRKGLFKKVEPIQIQPFVSLDSPDKTQLFTTPVVGWNAYNEWMFGAAFYNITLPEKKIEYVIMPMYSTGTKDIAGSADLRYNIRPKRGILQSIHLGVKGKRYAYQTEPFEVNFNKIAPEITFEFRKKRARSPYTHSIKIRNINIVRDEAEYVFDNKTYEKIIKNYMFNDVVYSLKNNRKINPFRINVNWQQSVDFIKTSLEAFYTITLEGRNKSIDFRFFAGQFMDNSKRGDYRFRLSGFSPPYNGIADYLYDYTFLGRSEPVAGEWVSQQFYESDGGFKIFTAGGQAQNWMTALNGKLSLPILPAKLFADVGVVDRNSRTREDISYDAGVCITLPKNIFEVYFPLIYSKDIDAYIKANSIAFKERIRFVLNFNLMNPFEFLRNFSF